MFREDTRGSAASSRTPASHRGRGGHFGNRDVRRGCRKIPAEFARESGQRSGVWDQISTGVRPSNWIQMMGIVMVC